MERKLIILPRGESAIQAETELHDSSPVFAAVLAHPINLERMPRSFVMMLAADLLLQAVDFGREEFD